MDIEKKEMSLEEAISHCEEKSHQSNTLCALDHKQLKAWLIELKELKKIQDEKSNN